MTEYWAHVYHEKPDFEEVEDDDFDLDKVRAAMANDEEWENVT